MTNDQSTAISGIIFNEKGEVLLQKHVKLKALTLPGGGQEKDESDSRTLVRELFEELGIIVYRYNKILTNKFKGLEYPANSENYIDFTQVYFTVDEYKGEPTNKEPNKHEEILWCKPEYIRGMGPVSGSLDYWLKKMNL